MKKTIFLFSTLILAHSSFADVLDGLAIFDFLIYVLFSGAISFLFLIIAALFRFTQKSHKVSVQLNIFASIFILCALISLGNLGSGIDPGFSAICIGGILLAIVLVIFNYGLGNTGDQQNK
jgi:peptidoglycan/LPS O-acetylase OafA/YrhL